MAVGPQGVRAALHYRVGGALLCGVDEKLGRPVRQLSSVSSWFWRAGVAVEMTIRSPLSAVLSVAGRDRRGSFCAGRGVGQEYGTFAKSPVYGFG